MRPAPEQPLPLAGAAVLKWNRYGMKPARLFAYLSYPPLAGVSTGTGLYLRIEDVQGIYDTALAAGGQSVIAPESTPWGSIRARVLDPEGTEFTFGTYEPGTS